jgi:heme oxygenase
MVCACQNRNKNIPITVRKNHFIAYSPFIQRSICSHAFIGHLDDILSLPDEAIKLISLSFGAYARKLGRLSYGQSSALRERIYFRVERRGFMRLSRPG